MLSLYPQTEHHLVVLSLLVGQFKGLLLPAKGHFWESYQLWEDLHLHNVIVRILEAQRFAIVVLVMIRVAPSVAIQQVASMICVFVVVEVELISLADSFEHDSDKYPWTYVESCQLYEHFSFGFAHFHQTRPVHLLISCFDDSIADSEEMFTGIRSQNVFGFDLPGFKDSFLSLLIVFFGHDV